MPVSVVVGGQFGSEGKGKVAHAIACREDAAAVVRVGGTNSGHTVVDARGDTWALRQLPASVLAEGVVAVLPPGAIIDPEIFLAEVAKLRLDPSRVRVSPLATLITDGDREAERLSGIVDRIGSTGSGTGQALSRRMARRDGEAVLARSDERLEPYFDDTTSLMRGLLRQGRRVVIEGSQGFGLSLLHGPEYPKATSRDATAATFVGEAGLSPLDVDDVTLVIRTYPIRVAGKSGDLPNEVTWADVAERARLPRDYVELTTSTQKVRRVGLFDPGIVRRAVEVNAPTRIVLNHVDYVDPDARTGRLGALARDFVEREVEAPLGIRIDWLGTSPADVLTDWRGSNGPK
ncbi:adenylosuccinate synthetase [Methylobacterium mesophilicum]|uniref:adenylosuccinate synthetase n=1 Tax=Methylobacterium mesophilicum TaxID=39956 RepID=UPI002F2E439F